MRIDEVHTHTPFELSDGWSSDPSLRHIVGRLVLLHAPARVDQILDSLAAFAKTCAQTSRPLAALCDRPGAEPRLVQYNEWGQRVDRVETSEGWRGLKDFMTVHGLVGEGYGAEGQEAWLGRPDSLGGRKQLGAVARLFSFARNFLFAPDSKVTPCPFSMTDGAVRTLELYGTADQKGKYLPKLLSRDPTTSWQSGQWMTEVIGGSDVGMTETRATPLVATGRQAKAGDLYTIHGFKWFSSAIDGHASLALACTSSDTSLGSKGLSLFLIPVRKQDRPPVPATASYTDETAATSPFNGIKVHRLKNKLGTRHVPTAELELCGAIGELIGQEGRGVAQIASVLNITRIYSATGCVAAIARSLEVASSYAQVRAVGVQGRATLLKDIPMHADRLARVGVCYRALLQLYFPTTLLLGKAETGTATPRELRRLRMLTPVCKAFVAFRTTECIAQSIEAMGGQGYMAENPLPEALRDTLVERIWEGTPSILSLDVARIMVQTKGLALTEWLQDCAAVIDASTGALVAVDRAKVEKIGRQLDKVYAAIKTAYIDGAALTTGDGRYARSLLELIAIVTSGVGLVEQAAWSASPSTAAVERGDAGLELETAVRWICGTDGGLDRTLSELDALMDGAKLASFDSQLAFSSKL